MLPLISPSTVDWILLSDAVAAPATPTPPPAPPAPTSEPETDSDLIVAVLWAETVTAPARVVVLPMFELSMIARTTY